MQLFHILQAALLLASQIGATPVPESGDLTPNAALKLLKRAIPAPVTCGPAADQQAWPLATVQGAYSALVSGWNGGAANRPAAGNRTYPRQYGRGSNPPTDPDVVTALNAITECKTGQRGKKYFEFPLTDPVFTGGPQGSQGPDRVVAISPTPPQGAARNFTYCLAMTHRGGAGPGDGSFRPCANT